MKLPRPSPLSHSLLPLFVLAHFAHHVVTAATAPLLPLIRDSFSLSYTQAGLLLSVFSLSYGLAQLPAGWLNDRIGAPLLIFLGIGGVAAGGLLAGLAPSFSLLLVAQLAMGLCGAGYHPSATTLISRVTPPERRGSALGIHVTGGSLTYFAAPLMAAGLAALWGWRGSILALSAPTLALGVGVLVLLRRASRRDEGLGSRRDPSPDMAHTARFWVHLAGFLLLSASSGALVGSTAGFIPLLAVDRYGFSEQAAAGLMALVYSGGMWVAPLAGLVADKLGRAPLLVASSLLAAPTIYLVPRLASSGATLYVLLVLLGMFVFIRMPASESFLVTEAPPRARSLLLGVYFLGGSVGHGVMTPFIGSWTDHGGFVRSFSLVAALLLAVTLVCGATLAATGQRRTDHREGIRARG